MLSQGSKSELVMSLTDPLVLAAVAEDLRAPLLQIAYAAELAKITGNTDAIDDICRTARLAMAEVDNLLLGLKNTEAQIGLPLTPRAPSSITYEVLQELKPLAGRYGCSLRLEKPAQKTAMIHASTLKQVISSLTQELMKLATGYSRQPELVFDVQSTHRGSSISVTTRADIKPIMVELFGQVKRLQSRKPSAMLLANGPAAGFYVAERLLASMEAELKSVVGKRSGFKIELLPSTQLSMV